MLTYCFSPSPLSYFSSFLGPSKTLHLSTLCFYDLALSSSLCCIKYSNIHYFITIFFICASLKSHFKSVYQFILYSKACLHYTKATSKILTFPSKHMTKGPCSYWSFPSVKLLIRALPVKKTAILLINGLAFILFLLGS